MGTEVVQQQQQNGNITINELTNDAATHCKPLAQLSSNKHEEQPTQTAKQQQQQQQEAAETVELLNCAAEQYAMEAIVNEFRLPTASPPPQVITVATATAHEPEQQPATIAVTTAAKKVRRAFSMPRNPFRWSRKFKTENHYAGSGSGISNSALSSCVGGGRGRAGSIVSLNSYEAISKDTNGNAYANTEVSNVNSENEKNLIKSNMQSSGDSNGNANVTANGAIGNNNATNNNNNNNSSSQKRVLRRSSFRKFLNRIAHQLSNSINVGGSDLTIPATTITTSSTNKSKFIDIIPYYTGCWRRKEANKQAAAGNTQTQVTQTAMGTLTARTRNLTSTNERVPPINGYQWPADQTPGVMGLKNHGNTCFMNAVLQCLSHTDILAEYFVLDQYKADLKRRNKINSRKFGTKGELTEQLANVLKALWTCKNESDHSTSFKAVVERYGSQFRSSTQHDAQEFLFWLLDKVHEDLNTATKRRYKSVKNTYGRPDEVLAAETLANHIRCNNSFVQAVFQAQFRSSLTCPRCKKQSNTFDPFHCISVQLPQLTQQIIYVTVVYSRLQQPQQVKYGLTVPAGSPIIALREQLQIDTGIASERIVLVDLGPEGFTRVFYDSQPVATLQGNETIYCIEMPETKSAVEDKCPTAATTTAAAAATAATTISASAETTTNTVNTTTHATDLMLLVANVRKQKVTSSEPSTTDAATENSATDNDAPIMASSTAKLKFERFGAPFSMQVPRDCSYTDLQKRLLREMSAILRPEVFSYATPLNEMFRIRLQDPSADPDTYIEQVEHPLLTEMIDLALSVLSAESGPSHVKLLLEWAEPEQYFQQLSSTIVDHESVARLRESKPNETAALTLEQCLEHYTKAETLSAEDAWRCPHCQQYLPVVKTLGLWSLPDILVVHFKRFRQHHGKNTNAAKLTTMVKFPLTAFDMSPHLARGANGETPATTADAYRPSPWRKTRPGDSRSSTLSSRADNKETRYDLYAVCYHQGDTLETGHYTAACKNPYDRQWYKFDDQRVSKVPSDDITDEIINNEAYMLFYQRRTAEASECSGSSSNSSDHWISRIAPPVPSTAPPTAITLLDSNQKLAENSPDEEQHGIEKLPDKAETKPVDVPKLNDETIRAASPSAEALTTTTAAVTIEAPVNVNELNFADDEEAQLPVSEKAIITVPAVQEQSTDQQQQRLETTEIFAMDEDAATLDNATTALMPVQTSAAKEAAIAPIALPERKSTPPIATANMNGYHANDVCTDGTLNAHVEEHANAAGSPKSQASSVSSASSSTSLSSRSSPHSLAASTFGATTLQSKFNSFAKANNNSISSSYRESFAVASNTRNINTTFKSNSSSIIAAGSVAALSHEYQVIRTSQQHQHQPQHWHGSRSSVSALENATQHNAAAAHAHGLNLRHSFSTSSNYKFRECNDTLSSLLRNSANTCSKDTLLFIDQQNHPSLMEDDDDNFMGSRSLWISPVTPHKLITVSPKN